MEKRKSKFEKINNLGTVWEGGGGGGVEICHIMPNGWRTIKSLVHRIRLRGRQGKGTAESFSREKLRHAP